VASHKADKVGDTNIVPAVDEEEEEKGNQEREEKER
jgi:hypothetical protein